MYPIRIIQGIIKEILDILKKLAHNDGKCVIIVTHSSNVCEMVDQIYDLKKVK